MLAIPRVLHKEKKKGVSVYRNYGATLSVGNIGNHKDIRKLTFRALALRRIPSDEGLTLKTSASQSLRGGQFTL